MRIVSFLILILFPCLLFAIDQPLITDSRIRSYIYNPNEVFRIVVHYGYQTSLEFEKDEKIQTIYSGNSYAWQITPINYRIFIKPLEDNILTNMTIITDKRVYQMEIQSKPYSESFDNELVYVVRFFYPGYKENGISDVSVKKEKVERNVFKPYNFNYVVTGDSNLLPEKVFDDGAKTYIYLKKSAPLYKDISVISNNEKLQSFIVGDYMVINTVRKNFKLKSKKGTINVENRA